MSNVSEAIAKIMELMAGQESDENRSGATEERLLGLIKNIYEMIKVFKQTDANGDGKLSVDEMKTALSGMLPTQSLPEPVVQYLDKQLEEFDTNGDGNISLSGNFFYTTNTLNLGKLFETLEAFVKLT